MPYLQKVQENPTSQQITDTFLGYNHNLKIADGEFYDEENLTTDYYPLFANRKPRGTVAQLTDPQGIIGKASLAYIDGSELYYNGQNVTSYLTSAGVAISTSELMRPKQLVSMGAYIIIYPDKLYFNTENPSDCGSIEARYSAPSASTILIQLCKSDGVVYGETTVSPTEPENPTDGMLWIDSSAAKHVLKQFSAYSAQWALIATTYVRIQATGIGQNFSDFDGINISGIELSEDPVLNQQLSDLMGSKVIYSRGNDFITVIGLLDNTYTYEQTTGSLAAERTMPDVDYLTEAENRLWGCKYGFVDGHTVNELYCCALGDFKNWNKFLGISTDSWVGSCGTDGKWTGAITHMGYPLFFKENYLHKIYISSTGAHQVVDTACRGVQDGCSKSLAIVNETLYFKSRGGICAYDGSLPVAQNENFGTERYFDAVAGAYENKYYVSMRDTADDWHLFVLDTAKGIWHREDSTHALGFAKFGDELYYLDADTEKLIAENGTTGTLEESVAWRAKTGLIGYTTVEQKYVTRFNLRMKLPKGSKADMYIEYDSDGIWHFCGHMEGVGTNTFMLPVRPRRCDHFRFGIEGNGDIRIYSFARIYEVGSDG